jgi:hypothetical protein
MQNMLTVCIKNECVLWSIIRFVFPDNDPYEGWNMQELSALRCDINIYERTYCIFWFELVIYNARNEKHKINFTFN